MIRPTETLDAPILIGHQARKDCHSQAGCDRFHLDNDVVRLKHTLPLACLLYEPLLAREMVVIAISCDEGPLVVGTDFHVGAPVNVILQITNLMNDRGVCMGFLCAHGDVSLAPFKKRSVREAFQDNTQFRMSRT